MTRRPERPLQSDTQSVIVVSRFYHKHTSECLNRTLAVPSHSPNISTRYGLMTSLISAFHNTAWLDVSRTHATDAQTDRAALWHTSKCSAIYASLIMHGHFAYFVSQSIVRNKNALGRAYGSPCLLNALRNAPSALTRSRLADSVFASLERVG